jgi:hypothetical protein
VNQPGALERLASCARAGLMHGAVAKLRALSFSNQRA